VEKVKPEARFDGKWVLTINTDLTAEKIALKYKESLQVERVFKDIKVLISSGQSIAGQVKEILKRGWGLYRSRLLYERYQRQ